MALNLPPHKNRKNKKLSYVISICQSIKSAHDNVLADDFSAAGRRGRRLEGHHVMRLLVEAVAVIILALPALGPEGIPRQSASGCRRTGLAAGPAVHSPVSILVRVQAQIEEIGGQTKSPSDGPVPTSTTF